jgi:hypothetical protein
MGDIYETHIPVQHPDIAEQPILEVDSLERSLQKIPNLKETIDRWRKEIIEKIGSLRKDVEQVYLENETVTQELNRLKSELTTKKERVHVLEHQIAQTLEAFNQSIKRLQEIETKWTQALRELETIILIVEEKTKGFEEEGKKKNNAKSPFGVFWIGLVAALLLSLISLGIQLWGVYGTTSLSAISIPIFPLK